MDPIDILSGAGARARGGGFAPVGTLAVYLSATDSGASKEVTARKSRLGGVGQISIDKYPRVVYAVAVDLKNGLNLSSWIVAGSGSRKDVLSRQERFGPFDGIGPRIHLQ